LERARDGRTPPFDAFFHRLFPHPSRVAMLVIRSKRDPLSVAFFVHDSQGAVEVHSPAQEFTLDILRYTKHLRPRLNSRNDRLK